MEKRPCRNCADDIEEYRQMEASIKEYLESLSDEIKADSGEYERRVSICRDCANNRNAMCRICGCFIETRAAKKHNACPDIKKYW